MSTVAEPFYSINSTISLVSSARNSLCFCIAAHLPLTASAPSALLIPTYLELSVSQLAAFGAPRPHNLASQRSITQERIRAYVGISDSSFSSLLLLVLVANRITAAFHLRALLLRHLQRCRLLVRVGDSLRIQHFQPITGALPLTELRARLILPEDDLWPAEPPCLGPRGQTGALFLDVRGRIWIFELSPMLIPRPPGRHLTQRSIFGGGRKVRAQELHPDHHQQQHSSQQVAQYATSNFESTEVTRAACY
jgi:hypothetical protein